MVQIDPTTGMPASIPYRIPPVRRPSAVDWIVPTHPHTRDTVQRRLQPTIEVAKKRMEECHSKSKLVGATLNSAIGLQIVIGALITGLAVVTTGHGTSIMTAILGAFTTILSAFLARMRGTGEPERSKSSAKGFERFIRTCEAYILDFGEESGREPQHFQKVNEFRQEFEDLEGSMNAEQQGNHPNQSAV